MIRFLLALVLLASSAAADVFVVSSGGSGDFTQIQQALDNTTDSDLILVNAGSYTGFTVTNRTATIIGIGSVSVSGLVSISNVASNQSVVLSGLDIQGDFGFAASIQDSAGAIRLQDCFLWIVDHVPVPDTAALHIENCDNVSVVTCDVQGGLRLAYGMLVVNSSLAAAQSAFRGGFSYDCSNAQHGIVAQAASFLFASGVFSTGVSGGDYVCTSPGSGYYCEEECGSDGGHGLVLSATSEAQLLDTILLGGPGGFGASYTGSGYDCVTIPCNGAPGEPFSTGPGTTAPTALTGTARRSSYAASVLEGDSLSVSVEGEVGDEVSLLLSKAPLFDRNVVGTGVRLVGAPTSDPNLYREVPLGTLTMPVMNFTAVFPLETSAFQHDTWFAQTVFTAADQSDWYGPGRALVVLDAPGSFDPVNLCSGDGGDQLGCTDCPCGNNAPAGSTGGCLNSFSTSARLAAIGSPSVSLASESTHDLRISVTGAPPTSFCRLVSGTALAPGGMANPCFGLNSGVQSVHFDGLRCAISGVLRHGGRSADANGEIGANGDAWGGEGAPNVGLAGQHGFAAGQTRYFQMVNRDFPDLSCMTGLNTTQAIEITFTP